MKPKRLTGFNDVIDDARPAVDLACGGGSYHRPFHPVLCEEAATLSCGYAVVRAISS